ncbi:MAG TPA: glycosyltransferase family 9 protein [Cytophagales bacterium]|nr:glycosyltransferase family 9 protein [Cytophagales bacterium]
MAEESFIPDVKKIAILRSGALGDFIVVLPAIESIKQTYPDAEIVLLGSPWLKPFLEDRRTPFDRFLSVPVYSGVREENAEDPDLFSLEAFFKSMQEEKFDIALQFQGKGLSANPFIKRLGAKLTVGMETPDTESLDRSIRYYYYQSEPLRFLEIVKLIGGKPVDPEPKVKVFRKDKEEIEELLPEITNKPYIVLHPFAMDIRRSWPLEKFAELGEILHEIGFTIVFTGSKQDKELVETIFSKGEFPAINACGILSLGGLCALLSKSHLVVSSDTGPLHLARAVGAKTIGIYWAPNLINWGPLTRSNHRPVISWEMQCPICGIMPNQPYPFEPQGETCSHNISFVKNVQVGEVLNEVKEMLNIKF